MNIRFLKPLSIQVLLVLVAAWAGQAHAQTVDVSIDGNEANARIELIGTLTADLTIRFENAVGLTEQSLGLSVSQVDPLSLALLGRLPDPTSISIPSGFPLMITIDPPENGGLSFEGIAEVEIYTTALHYTPLTPLRLFKSTGGAPFRDITAQNSAGSYRVRGSGGQWSDFLIVSDTRPLTTAIDEKFANLQETLTATSGDIDAGVFATLQALVDDAEGRWLSADAPGAVQKLVELDAEIRAGADAGKIPNVWRSARDLENAAGMLRARAATLKFSLGLAG